MVIPATGSAFALARFPLLAGVPAEVVSRFAGYLRWLDAAAEQVVLDFEDRTTDVLFVEQGSVRVLMRTADGAHTQILGDFGPGALIGEMSAIDNAPRSARVEALVRTRLGIMPAAAFIDLTLSSRDVALRVMRLLTARIRSQNRRLLEHTALPIRLRLAAELLRIGRPRPDGSRALSPPPTQEELAARVGARRETVSRELAAFSRAGLTHRTRSALVVDDPDALRAMIEARLDQSVAAQDRLSAEEWQTARVGAANRRP